MRAEWLLGLLVALPLAVAANGVHQVNLALCHADRHFIVQSWQRNDYQAPSDVQPLMLAAIRGDASRVIGALAAIPPKHAQRWRQLALYYAALFGHPATVDGLLTHGANVDARTPIPAFFICKRAMYGQAEARYLHAEPPVSGEMQNPRPGCIAPPHSMGPAITAAIECDEAETVAVLLRHGSEPMRPILRDFYSGHPYDPDPFVLALWHGNPDIVDAMLARGANPCIEDRRLVAGWEKMQAKKYSVNPMSAKPATVASFGRKAGLPPALVQRLVCHAPPAVN